MAKRYRVKSVVEAVQFTGGASNAAEVIAFCGKDAAGSNRAWHQVYGESEALYADFGYGPLDVELGAWVAKHEDGKLFLFGPDFLSNWEEVA